MELVESVGHLRRIASFCFIRSDGDITRSIWLHEEWAFPIPRDSVALTDLNALRGMRITEVMRWEHDQWEIFTGPGPGFPESQRRVVPMGVLLAADSSLLPAVELPVGRGYWRDAESDWNPWGEDQGKSL